MHQKYRRLCPKAFWIMVGGLLAALLFAVGEFLLSYFKGHGTGDIFYRFFFEDNDLTLYMLLSVGSLLFAAYLTFLIFTFINGSRPVSSAYTVVLMVFCTAMAVYFGILFTLHMLEVDTITNSIRLAKMNNQPPPADAEESLFRFRMGFLTYGIGMAINAVIIIGVVVQRKFIKSGKQYYGKSKLA